MKKLKYTTEEFIVRAEKTHGKRYNYERSVYIGSDELILINCRIHGDFWQNVILHVSGSNCPKCVNKENPFRQKLTTKEFIERAIKFHAKFGRKYNYSKTDYKTTLTKVIIICDDHGEFLQSPKSHLKYGCDKCAQEFRHGIHRFSQEEFVKRCHAVIEHEKDHYDYSKTVYKNYNEKVIIICTKNNHGEFLQTPHSHLDGQGCPKCIKKVSLAETKWLDQIGIDLKYRYFKVNVNSEKYFYADGFDPKTNTIYEFHGDYWHGNPEVFDSNKMNTRTGCTFGELYQKTLNKERLLKEAGYNVVSIWENDFIKLEAS